MHTVSLCKPKIITSYCQNAPFLVEYQSGCGVRLPHIASDLLKNGFAGSLVLGILQSHVIVIKEGTQRQVVPGDVVRLGSPVKRNHQRDISHDLVEIRGTLYYPIAAALFDNMSYIIYRLMRK